MPAVAAAETRETSPPVSAEVGETNDERDERPESNDDEDVRRSGREGDAPEPARGGLTASDQMARLAALKEEEEAPSAESRVPDRANRKPPRRRRGRRRPRRRETTGSKGRRTRARLMRAQSTRAAKRSAAAKEQTKSVSSSDDAKTSEDEAFEARVRAAKGETFEEMNDSGADQRTTATDAPDPRPPVGGWDEKPSAAAPPASARAEELEFEIPKMPEKSFDEMSFEERVASAMAQSRNSGVADRVQKALIRGEGGEQGGGEGEGEGGEGGGGEGGEGEGGEGGGGEGEGGRGHGEGRGSGGGGFGGGGSDLGSHLG